MPVANVNGTSLYYETIGRGHPVVLIHGFAMDNRMWDDQYEVFGQTFQVIRYDMRGFGKSALPGTQLYSHSEDLNALLDFLTIDSAIIVGLSRGGRWAIQFALDHKEKVNALVLVDSRPNGFILDEGAPSLAKEITTQALTVGIPAAKKAWLSQPIFESARSKPNVLSRLKEMVLDYSGWHWLNDDPLLPSHPPASQRLNEIPVPTLVIVGEKDTEDFRKAADFLHHQITGSQKTILWDVGHFSNMEDPLAFNNSVQTFIKRIPALN